MPGSLATLAHRALCSALRPGDIAVDATCGNGGDTLVLAESVGPNGIVWALDLQPAAIETAKSMLTSAGWTNVRWRAACHSRLLELVGDDAGEVGAVAFNLGYLPRGDRSIVTRTETTIAALNGAWAALRPSGVLTIVAYRAHPGGQEESAAVGNWLSELGKARVEIRASERPTTTIAAEELPWLAIVQKPAP